MATKEQIADQIRSGVLAYCGERLDEPFNTTKPIVRLHEPTYGGEEVWAALETLLTTRVTMGAKVRAFEQAYADKFGFSDAVMVNSGSSANLLAVAALVNPACENGLKVGDEVIVPALSWSTTVWPLVQLGLVPVLVDHDPKTLNLDPEQVEKAIGPKTRAIKLVHVYGNPCDMDAIMDIAKRHNLQVIEDSCESMGAYYKGKAIGGIGRVGTFSTYFSHHITTLEGGFCVTNDPEFAELMRVLRAHGWTRELKRPEKYLAQYPEIDRRFLFINSGFNLRATETQAAMGLIQLPKLDQFIATRTTNTAFFRERLAKYEDHFEFVQVTPGATSSWFGFPMTIKAGSPVTVKALCAHLNADGIETRPLIAGNMAEQPAMKLFPHRIAGDLPNATHIMRHGFTFGNHHAICNQAREHIVASVECFMAQV